MYFISHSRFISLRSMSDRMDLIQIIKEAWSGTRTGPRPIEGTGAGVYKWSSRKGHSFSLGLHTTVFQAEI
jgi:hypothetical protein